MSEYVLMLIFLPLVFAVVILPNSTRVRNIAVYLFVSFLAFLSIKIFLSQSIVILNFNHIVHTIFIIIDFILMGYFLHQGVKYKDKLIAIFAIIQLLLFVIFLQFSTGSLSNDIIVDKVSLVMLLVVNIVGGIIILYSLQYIQSEDFKDCKKNLFISILFFFLGVMNLVVTTNNIEIFFLGFELTTLCSYILIRYRQDPIAIENAKRALWMNQIGGVAILLTLISGVYYYDAIYFDKLLAVVDDNFLVPISLLIIAAFVKGASIPFDKWLLGAMVAPTPVSAILHSATMVKIAPYLILKIAPSFSPLLAIIVVLFGSFIFLSGSLLALGKDYFKEILGYSTIALLGFMMAMAAINTPTSINIALIVIVFHAISKALLFLQAGILEKIYHLKYLQDINYLASQSPFVVACILIGFASLTLPPFGVFIGKFASIELLTNLIDTNIIYLLSLIFILLGSVVLTLLYFKVVTKLIPQEKREYEHLPIGLAYQATSLMLVGLLFFGIYISYQYNFMNQFDIAIALGLFLLTFFMLYFVNFKNIKKVKEYSCGEKDEVSLSAYYFYIPESYKKVIIYLCIFLMATVVFLGLV
jgi:ech hydrogenase subunit A